MKILWSACASALLLCGCGGNEQMDLDHDSANFVDNKFESGMASCDEGPVVSLRQAQAVGYSPEIKFVANKGIAASHEELNKAATISERCKEIQTHFSGASLGVGAKTVPNDFGFEIGFSTTGEQDQQLLSGQSVNLRPESGHLSFTDGIFKDMLVKIDIRCPSFASVSCKITEIGDYKKCEGYNVSFSDTCTFRGDLVPFSFSDHKSAMLDVSGEIEIAEQGRTEIRFTKIAWMDLY